MRRLVGNDAFAHRPGAEAAGRRRKSRSRSPSRRSAWTTAGAPTSRTGTARRGAKKLRSRRRANGPGLNDLLLWRGVHRLRDASLNSARPQSVSPRSYATSGAAAITMKYAGMRRASRQVHSFFGDPSWPRTSARRYEVCSPPRLSRRRDRHATSPSPCRSVVDAWNPVARAVRQLSPKYVHRPAESCRAIKPSTTVPP